MSYLADLTSFLVFFVMRTVFWPLTSATTQCPSYESLKQFGSFSAAGAAAAVNSTRVPTAAIFMGKLPGKEASGVDPPA